MGHFHKGVDMLCRFLFFLTISLFLVMPEYTANAQNGDEHAFASGNSVKKILPRSDGAGDRSNEIEIEAQILELQLQLLKNPGDAIFLNNLATKYARLGRMDEALSTLRRSLASDDTQAKTHLNLGNLYDRLGRYNDALNAVARSVQLDPKNKMARSYLCELDMLTLRNSEAVKCYRDYFIEFDAAPRFRTNFGVALMRAGELKESVAVLEKLAAERPRDSTMQNVFAVALYASNDYKSAIRVLENAVENDPDRADLRLNLGFCYLAADNRPGALGQYRLLKVSNSSHAKTLYRHLYRNYVVDVREMKRDHK